MNKQELQELVDSKTLFRVYAIAKKNVIIHGEKIDEGKQYTISTWLQNHDVVGIWANKDLLVLTMDEFNEYFRRSSGI